MPQRENDLKENDLKENRRKENHHKERWHTVLEERAFCYDGIHIKEVLLPLRNSSERPRTGQKMRTLQLQNIVCIFSCVLSDRQAGGIQANSGEFSLAC